MRLKADDVNKPNGITWETEIRETTSFSHGAETTASHDTKNVEKN